LPGFFVSLGNSIEDYLIDSGPTVAFFIVFLNPYVCRKNNRGLEKETVQTSLLVGGRGGLLY
jgi:hypothetical protein